MASISSIWGSKRDQPAVSPLFASSAFFLAIWILFGGNMPVNVILFGILAAAGTLLIAVTTLHGGLASWSSLSVVQRIALAFFCMMPLIQVIPLPPSIWQALPGRSLPQATLEVVDLAHNWQPITLAFGATFRTFLVSLWLAAFLLTLLRLSTEELQRLFRLILILGLLNVAIGFVQIVSGGSALQFYPSRQSMFLSGLFANKNHTGLFIAITFLAGYIALYGRDGATRRGLSIVVPVGLLCFAALLATFSRAGIVFGGLAIGFLAVLTFGARVRRGRRRLTLWLAIAAAALLVLIGSTDLATRSLTRFEGVDSDLRWSIWQWSWPLVLTYFPIGSGIGSFTAIFPAAEQLAWVKPTYVNHVHNDFIEQLIEAGVAAPTFWLLIVASVAGPLRCAWKTRTRQSGRLAVIGAAMLMLIAMHSTVDYPLRRPAISAVAMLALAALLRAENSRRRLHHSSGREDRAATSS